jgi:hypothetical protein
MFDDPTLQLIEELLGDNDVDVYSTSAAALDLPISAVYDPIVDLLDVDPFEARVGPLELAWFCQRLARNQSTPATILSLITNRYLSIETPGVNRAELLIAVVENTNLDVGLLACIVERVPGSQMAALWRRLAAHPQLDSWSQTVTARKCEDRAALVALASRDDLAGSAAAELATRVDHTKARVALLGNPTLGPVLDIDVDADQMLTVRLAAARSHAVTDAVLWRLRDDPATNVSSAAGDELARRGVLERV